MKRSFKNFFLLFVTMMKIGLFTFGGGFAMIALLENEFVTGKKWINKDEFIDMIAITGSAPGSVGINTATYLGYKMLGLGGSIVAIIGACIPSFVILYLISLFFDAFLSLTAVAYAFRGIQVCVIYLIMSAGIKMFKGIEKTPFAMVILSLTVICMVLLSVFALRFSTVFYILISGTLGVAFFYLSKLVKSDSKKEEK